MAENIKSKKEIARIAGLGGLEVYLGIKSKIEKQNKENSEWKWKIRIDQ